MRRGRANREYDGWADAELDFPECSAMFDRDVGDRRIHEIRCDIFGVLTAFYDEANAQTGSAWSDQWAELVEDPVPHWNTFEDYINMKSLGVNVNARWSERDEAEVGG